MTVKLTILKTGENLVADVKEGVVGDKTISYILEDPCAVINYMTDVVVDGGDQGEKSVSVYMERWPRYSKEHVVAVSVDSVMTILEPKDEIKQLYLTNIGKYEHQVTSTDEQPDSDQSD